jgi:hypothetical protein
LAALDFSQPVLFESQIFRDFVAAFILAGLTDRLNGIGNTSAFVLMGKLLLLQTGLSIENG